MRKPRLKLLSPDEAATALSEAEATLARWAGESADQAHAAEVLAAELAGAEARAADDLLDAEDADDDAAAVTRIAAALERRRAEQGLAVQAAERAAERLAGVRRDVLRARAASIRARAARLREVAASRQARTDQLLSELQAFERTAFGPVTHSSSLGLGGLGIPSRTMTQDLLGRAQWLEDRAELLDRTAAEAADDQVTAAVSQGLPPLIEVELAVADLVTV